MLCGLAWELWVQVPLCAPIINIENKRIVASYGFIDTHWLFGIPMCVFVCMNLLKKSKRKMVKYKYVSIDEWHICDEEAQTKTNSEKEVQK